MKIEVNIQKKYFFVLLSAVLIIGAGILAYAFNSGGLAGTYSNTKENAVNFGHSSDEVVVDIAGVKYTLQDAINQGKLGSTTINNEVAPFGIVYDSGWVPRQDAMTFVHDIGTANLMGRIYASDDIQINPEGYVAYGTSGNGILGNGYYVSELSSANVKLQTKPTFFTYDTAQDGLVTQNQKNFNFIRIKLGKAAIGTISGGGGLSQAPNTFNYGLSGNVFNCPAPLVKRTQVVIDWYARQWTCEVKF